MIARRDGENIVVEIKTFSPASFEAVQRLARALEHRAGRELQVVYVGSSRPRMAAALTTTGLDLIDASEDEDQSRLEFLLLWSIIEAAARHRLSALKIPASGRISSSALLKMLVSEGIIEDDDYAALRRSLAARNAIAHGFLNRAVDAALFEEIRTAAKVQLATRSKTRKSTGFTKCLAENARAMISPKRAVTS
jgi:hypothetical protein